ncbi:MAG TPA: sugar transferase, partial [Patescibacteria group bacterium]|nr:sugar transferase [Patescibacteria group bacterium]
MKSNASLLYSLLLVVGDFLALVLAFVGAYILRVTFGLSFGQTAVAVPIHARTYLSIFLLLAPFWIIIFGMLGLYSSSIYEKRFAEAGRLFMGSFIGLLFVLGYAYVVNRPVFPAKLVPFYGFVLAFGFLLIFRNLLRWARGILFSYDIGITNLLVVGNTKISEEIVSSLWNSKNSGYRIVGVVGSKNIPEGIDVRQFETFEDAIHKLRASKIQSIVQTELFTSSDKNNEVLTFAQEHHIAYRFVPGNSELFVGNLQVELFRQSVPVVAVHQTALIGWGRVVKRLFDLIAGSLLLIPSIPLMLLIILAELIMGGDVFFRQTRLTRFNNKFRVFKFRTLKKAYNGLSPEEGFRKMGQPELIQEFRSNGDFLAHDPRLTNLGRFLRKTSLDELPQLFNVVKGDLSLVGPRALVPDELEL